MPREKRERENITSDYNKIVDELIDMIGGKEYCLRQLLCENDHKKFISDYRNKNRENILEQIVKFYDSPHIRYNNKNIIDIDISSGHWNKYILKIIFYDQENHRFFEFSIKTNKVEEISLFEAITGYDDEDSKSYSRSFYSKIKGGSLLWDKYNKISEEKKMEEIVEKLNKEKQLFAEKMKKFNFVSLDDAKESNLELIEAPEQYKDGKTRYLNNNIFYYKLVGINGYITLNEGKDIMLEPSFAKLFYDNIVKKLREE
jgi:hypothetical protein